MVAREAGGSVVAGLVMEAWLVAPAVMEGLVAALAVAPAVQAAEVEEW